MNISDSLVVCVCLAPASGTATHYWPKVTYGVLPGFMLGRSVLSAMESPDTFLEHGWYASTLSSGIVFGIQGSTLLMSVTYSFFLFFLSFLTLGGASFCGLVKIVEVNGPHEVRIDILIRSVIVTARESKVTGLEPAERTLVQVSERAGY